MVTSVAEEEIVIFAFEEIRSPCAYKLTSTVLEPSWTMPYVPVYYTDKPVYVLTGPHSFSGAELLAYDLQALRRAVIVGEVTGGAAHGADWHRLPHECDALVSYSYPLNPITNANWEAVGVQPDIAVPQAEALRTAHIAALQTVLATAKGNARTEIETALQTLMQAKPYL